MIHYHGTPITPETAALRVLKGRHACVSYADPRNIGLVAESCQSFMLDNGAFSFWKAGKATDWLGYYRWCSDWMYHPGCDFALIPDVIDGDERQNDALIEAWPFKKRGVPVWQMHETTARLAHLCRSFEKVAIGSSGQYAEIGNDRWWQRMALAMQSILDAGGRPIAKLHGLRMLDPSVFTKLPFNSADSTNIARNIGIDSAWKGTYMPASKETRAVVLAERIEQHNAAARWQTVALQQELAA